MIKKIESVGGIEKNLMCSDDERQQEKSFRFLEETLNSRLPDSYRDFYRKFGAFSFLNLIYVKCIEVDSIMLNGKVSVGDFYCLTGNETTSVSNVLSTFQEQLPIGLLPICEGELGDIICMSLRSADYESIYYFNHESPPGSDLFLISTSFKQFIMSLKVHNDTIEDDELVKKMKMELSPQMLALLKKSGYGPKE